MKSRSVIVVLVVVIVALLYLLFRGLFINIERRSVYSGPWSCGHNADLGPFRVEVHPAARSDRKPYGSPAIRGFRVGLSFNKKSSTNAAPSVVKAIYTYAPLNNEYEKARHPMTVLEATRQPGSINQAYTVFLQPDDHLDDKKFVREGRYKLQIDLDCEGKEASLVAEVNLEYRRKVAVFGSPLIYLWHNLKAK